MVDVMGYVALGLLWALPAWFVWADRVGLTFVGLVVLTAPVPDVDLWIERAAPALVHHHGVTHTVAFVVLVSVLAGAVVAVALVGPVDRWLRSEEFDRPTLFAFAFGAFLLGGLSHLFGDVLSAPDVAQPIEPFWPLFAEPVALDLIRYNSPVWNLGLLIVAVLVHVALAFVVEPIEHPYRVR